MSPCDHDLVVSIQTGNQATRPRPDRLTRGSNQVVAGVCSGIAEYLGVDVVIVRVAFAVLTLTTGLGVPIYAMGWIMMPAPAATPTPAVAPLAKKTGPGAAGTAAAAAAARPSSRGLYHGLAVGMVFIGALLLLRNVNLAIPDALLVPVALAGCGAVVLWSRSAGDGERHALRRWAAKLPGQPFQRTSSSRTPIPIVRLLAGLLLVFLGLGVFIGTHQDPGGTVGPYELLAAMAITVVGLALMLGPWIWRMTNELTEERRERIRQEERADIAAHLHDSVLQTLALIQRNADNPKEVGALARRQERELRTWLYGDPSRRQNPTTLAGAMEAMVEEVERLHQVEVEMIVVGEDGPLDNRLGALVRASREAVVNAAKHSAAEEITVYVEIEPHCATVFVRDRGKGFDPDDVPDDRRGITESIRQRIERRGGRVEIWSAPGEGTEVQMEVPRA
jgi:signal transduction histidine kinase/phage shock protein PspC (stress-responsive transcriptional regulator)